jgi:hypothetical protein
VNRILLSAWILAVSCSILFGQTNSSSAVGQCPHNLTLNAPGEPEEKPLFISLPLNADSWPALPPDSRAEDPAEAPGLRLRGGGQWEKAAIAYRREEFHSAGLGGSEGASADISSQTQVAPLPAQARSLPKAPGLKWPGEPTPASSGQMSLEANPHPAQAALFSRIEREGLLKLRTPAFDSDFARKIEAAFRPEIMRVGSTEISSSIITAIARKNPFCLIEPTFDMEF